MNLQAGVQQKDPGMRISDHFFDQHIAMLAVTTLDPIIEKALLRTFGFRFQVAFFLVTEGLTVADQKLQLTGARAIDRRIVDLVNDSLPQGKPAMGATVVRSADPVFPARSPFWTSSGGTEGLAHKKLIV
jgi:hypothetical protein